MAQRVDALEVLKEDILRIAAERGQKAPLQSIAAEIKAPPPLVSKAVGALHQEGLVSVDDSSIQLTAAGAISAKQILAKHLAVENYYSNRRSDQEAHRLAHLLEHYVSREVSANMAKLSSLRETGIPLRAFGLHRQGLIAEIQFPDHTLFERLVSLGVFPGVVMEVTHSLPTGLVVKVGERKIALDHSIAAGIEVAEHART